MRYDLKTPCKDCPFLRNAWIFLPPARWREILKSLIEDNQTFTCHQTIDYEAWHDAGEFVQDEGNQHCAGALIMLAKAGKLNNNMIFRMVAHADDETLQRFGLNRLDLDALDLAADVITLEELKSHGSNKNMDGDQR